MQYCTGALIESKSVDIFIGCQEEVKKAAASLHLLAACGFLHARLYLPVAVLL